MQLARGDLVGLDGVLFRKEGAQVFHKAARDCGRNSIRLRGMATDIGGPVGNYESKEAREQTQRQSRAW
jgi:hypothetical protein